MFLVEAPLYIWLLQVAVNGEVKREHFDTYKSCMEHALRPTEDKTEDQLFNDYHFDGSMCIRMVRQPDEAPDGKKPVIPHFDKDHPVPKGFPQR